MRVVVVGASGNIGTSLLRALERDPAVTSVLGVARRLPELRSGKLSWARADVTTDDLSGLFAQADVVVALAWLVQPSRDEALLRRVNVDGSRRIFEATAAAGVPALVYSSSVGAYSYGPKDRRVDERWPTDGIPSAWYSVHKAAVERILDDVEAAHPRLRVVRLRPGLVFKREAGAEIRRLFLGPLLPTPLLRRGLIPIVPDTPRLRVQVVHSYDVGEAFRLACVQDQARGAYNIATEPVLDVGELARVLDARPVPVPARLLRLGVGLSWRAHLQPTSPGWVDLGLGVPLMDTRRAREQLGWSPAHDTGQALLELLDGLRENAGAQTPPLSPGTGGPWRVRELWTRVGARP